MSRVLSWLGPGFRRLLGGLDGGRRIRMVGHLNRHGVGMLRYAGEEEQAASGTDAPAGDEDGPWDDAGLSDAAGLYQGCPRTRARGTWDNRAGDRVYVVAT